MTKEQAMTILKEAHDNPKAHAILKVKLALKIASTLVKPS